MKVQISDWITVEKRNGYYIIRTTYLTDNDTVAERKATYALASTAIDVLVAAGENRETVRRN